MTEKTVIIKSALDARQVAFFVQTAGKFQSDIKIAIDNKKVSAKSIMGICAWRCVSFCTRCIMSYLYQPFRKDKTYFSS